MIASAVLRLWGQVAGQRSSTPYLAIAQACKLVLQLLCGVRALEAVCVRVFPCCPQLCHLHRQRKRLTCRYIGCGNVQIALLGTAAEGSMQRPVWPPVWVQHKIV
jgi:hypothetical protein